MGKFINCDEIIDDSDLLLKFGELRNLLDNLCSWGTCFNWIKKWVLIICRRDLLIAFQHEIGKVPEAFTSNTFLSTPGKADLIYP